MNDILNKIEILIQENDKKCPYDMVFIHSYEEFKRISLLLERRSCLHQGIYLIFEEDEGMLKQYLARLKKIREFFFEYSLEENLPDCLRPPHLYSGEIIKIKRESRLDRDDMIHIHYTNCRVRHVEDDGKAIIHVVPEESMKHLKVTTPLI